MRYASIDVGTNTLRLLIAEADGGGGGAGGGIRPILYRRAITRLGGAYTESEGIDASSAQRAFAALEGFATVIAGAGVDEVHATATSVVRRAVNRDWFVEEAARRTGIRLRVITGDTEARLSLLGVLSVVDPGNGSRLVIDIGGGSTEYIAADGTEPAGAWSMEMGVVHLTEARLASDPPRDAELASMEADIKAVLEELKGRMRLDGVPPEGFSAPAGASFVGTAGTITTLAAIDMDLPVYDRERINNHTLTKKRVSGLYRYLAKLTLKERKGILSLEKGREDLIIAGTAITLLSMDAFGFEEITVSDAGLLEGIIIDRVADINRKA
ncbi:MAG: exopolyphosphatase [Thermodesulfobacteriota bacterium]